MFVTDGRIIILVPRRLSLPLSQRGSYRYILAPSANLSQGSQILSTCQFPGRLPTQNTQTAHVFPFVQLPLCFIHGPLTPLISIYLKLFLIQQQLHS